jgi:hypothetical protein
MAPFSYSQECHDFSFPGAAAGISCSFGSSVTAGSLIAVQVWQNTTSPALSSVTDTQGNTYFPVLSPQVGGYGQEYMYYAVAASSGALSVSASFSAFASFPLIQAAEFLNSAASPLDGSGSNNAGTNQQSVVAASNDELVLLMGIPQAAGSHTAGAGFIQTAALYGMIYAIETAAGTYTPTLVSGGNNGVIAATFKSTSSGGGGATPKPTMILLT